MNKRKFVNIDISEIGLGTWQLGNADWGIIEKEQAFSILQKFVELGGNFIDTADVYGGGTSEKVIGEFIKTREEKIYVASKLGRRQDGENGWPQNFTYEYIIQHVEDSLERLKVNSIFLEQFHCIPSDELQSGKVFDYIRRIQDEGLIEHWGVSVETSEEAILCMEQEGISSIQIIFNLFRQHVADELFHLAEERGIAIIARVPLASGLLSGKFNTETRFPNTDHRNYNANGEYFNVGETFSGVEFKQGLEFVEKINKLFGDQALAQNSLRWILDHPAVTTVIPGASKIDQVVSNMAVSDLPPLENNIVEQLREIYDAEIFTSIRGEF